MSTSKAQKHALEQLVIREFRHRQDPTDHTNGMIVASMDNHRLGNITGQTMNALINKGYIILGNESSSDTSFYRRRIVALTNEARQIGIDQIQIDAHDSMEAEFKRRHRETHDHNIAFDIMDALVVEFPDAEAIPSIKFSIRGFKIKGISTDELVKLFVSNNRPFGQKTRVINSETQLPAYVVTPKLMLQIAADLEKVARAAAITEGILSAVVYDES